MFVRLNVSNPDLKALEFPGAATAATAAAAAGRTRHRRGAVTFAAYATAYDDMPALGVDTNKTTKRKIVCDAGAPFCRPLYLVRRERRGAAAIRADGWTAALRLCSLHQLHGARQGGRRRQSAVVTKLVSVGATRPRAWRQRD